MRARPPWSTLLALALVACSSSPPSPVEPGRDFTLAVGASASLGPAGEIRFVRVVSDRRCPRSTECAGSGPVTVEVSIGSPSAPATFELSVLDRDRGEPLLQGIRSCAPAGAQLVRLRDVEPWPPSRSPVPSSDYRATFVLTSSCAADAGPPR